MIEKIVIQPKRETQAEVLHTLLCRCYVRCYPHTCQRPMCFHMRSRTGPTRWEKACTPVHSLPWHNGEDSPLRQQQMHMMRHRLVGCALESGPQPTMYMRLKKCERSLTDTLQCGYASNTSKDRGNLTVPTTGLLALVWLLACRSPSQVCRRHQRQTHAGSCISILCTNLGFVWSDLEEL